MAIGPDELIYWQWGVVKLNATIVFTWVIMLIMAGGAWLITRKVTSAPTIGRGQNLLEAIVVLVRDQIREVSKQAPDRFLPFVGTLFLFIAMSNLLNIVPGFQAPTGSLSTTTALALCVFVAVPIYGISQQGWRAYLRQYLQPSVFMLPFNIIGELSRTLALAVRLFGNVMSGTMIVGVLISIAPLFFPVIMTAFGLLTGMIQAYIFAILAMVYIASAMRAHDADAGQSGSHAPDASLTSGAPPRAQSYSTKDSMKES
jgi:F-type H+-transporting ATPase subunit a